MASLADGVNWEAAALQCARLDDGAPLGTQAAVLGGNRSFEDRRCDMVSICALIGFQEELPLALWCLRRDRRQTPAADVCRRGSEPHELRESSGPHSRLRPRRSSLQRTLGPRVVKRSAHVV